MPKFLRVWPAWAWALAACVAVNLAFSLVGLTHSLEEVHVFRQIQTALTTRSILEEGWSLAYPTPVFGPPWSVPMEFPIYETLVAWTCGLTGWPLESTGRIVALAFFYGMLPALFGAMGLFGVRRDRRWLLPAAVLLAPAYLYYSRAFMIESCALCGSVWFGYAYGRALTTSGRRWIVAAALLGMLAALAKITTFIVFLAVAALWTLWLVAGAWRRARNSAAALAPIWRGLLATLLSVVAGVAWVHYSDLVKASNPLSAQLTSGSMHAFNFGTWPQRLSADFWVRLYERTTSTTVVAVNLTLVALFALLLAPSRRAAGALLLAGFLAGPLIFANLYFVHDYYYYATGVFLLGALALAWDQLLDLEAFPLKARYLAIALSLGAQVWVYAGGYLSVQRHPLRDAPELAAVLATATRPDDVVLVFGHDWDSALSYYSHRRTIMVTDARYSEPEKIHAVLDRLPRGTVGALVVTGPMRTYVDYVRAFTRKLGLTEYATLLNGETHVYLAQSRLPLLAKVVQANLLTTLNLAEPPDPDDAGIPRRRATPTEIENPAHTGMMLPKPVEILTPFGVSSHTEKGGPVFDAHAPTDVMFNVPPGAAWIEAAFGMLDSAYKGGNHTDGVEFRIELAKPGGGRQPLYSMYLSPEDRSEDRGLKRVRVRVPEGATGQLWFRTLPGPHNNIACDWAYWSRIVIK